MTYTCMQTDSFLGFAGEMVRNGAYHPLNIFFYARCSYSSRQTVSSVCFFSFLFFFLLLYRDRQYHFYPDRKSSTRSLPFHADAHSFFHSLFPFVLLIVYQLPTKTYKNFALLFINIRPAWPTTDSRTENAKASLRFFSSSAQIQKKRKQSLNSTIYLIVLLTCLIIQ